MNWVTARPVQGALYRQCPCLSRLHIRFKLQKRGTFKNGGRRSACYDFSCLDYDNISAKEKDFFRRMRLMALQTRKMRRNAVMLSIQQQNNINHRKRKTMWVYPRPQFWFEQLVVNHYQNHLCRDHFRVSRDTFEYICGLVGPQLIRQNTILRQAITVEKRVAVALWRLATGNSYRTDW